MICLITANSFVIKNEVNNSTYLHRIYPKGIILNKHTIDNHTLTYHFDFIFKGDQYICLNAKIVVI